MRPDSFSQEVAEHTPRTCWFPGSGCGPRTASSAVPAGGLKATRPLEWQIRTWFHFRDTGGGGRGPRASLERHVGCGREGAQSRREPWPLDSAFRENVRFTIPPVCV